MLDDWQNTVNTVKAQTNEYWDWLESARNGRPIVWLIGDSIFRGCATGRFDVEWDHPLKRANHIDLLLTEMFRENGIDLLPAFSGTMGHTQWLELVYERVRDGDVVVFQDAGLHTNSYRSHRAYIEFVKHLVLDNTQAKLKIMTIPSNAPATELFRHDHIVSGNRTINDAVIDAARGRHRGRVQIIDWHRVFAIVEPHCQRLLHRRLMQKDGIHPNVAGYVVTAMAVGHAVCPEASLQVEAWHELLITFTESNGIEEQTLRDFLREAELTVRHCARPRWSPKRIKRALSQRLGFR